MPPDSRGARRLGTAVNAIAAVLLAAGAMAPRWWSGSAGEADQGVGLRTVELCAGGNCASRAIDDLGAGSQTWPLLGATAFAIGWVAAAFLLAAAATARRGGAWGPRIARVAAGLSMFALVVGGGFAWTYPGFEGMSSGWAMAAFLGGAALGVGSAGILLGRRSTSAASAS